MHSMGETGISGRVPGRKGSSRVQRRRGCPSVKSPAETLHVLRNLTTGFLHFSRLNGRQSRPTLNSMEVVSGRVSVWFPWRQLHLRVRMVLPSAKMISPGTGCSSSVSPRGTNFVAPCGSKGQVLLHVVQSALRQERDAAGKPRLPMSTSALMEGISCPLTIRLAIASMEERNSAGFTPVFRKASLHDVMRGWSAGLSFPSFPSGSVPPPGAGPQGRRVKGRFSRSGRPPPPGRSPGRKKNSILNGVENFFHGKQASFLEIVPCFPAAAVWKQKQPGDALFTSFSGDSLGHSFLFPTASKTFPRSTPPPPEEKRCWACAPGEGQMTRLERTCSLRPSNRGVVSLKKDQRVSKAPFRSAMRSSGSSSPRKKTDESLGDPRLFLVFIGKGRVSHGSGVLYEGLRISEAHRKSPEAGAVDEFLSRLVTALQFHGNHGAEVFHFASPLVFSGETRPGPDTTLFPPWDVLQESRHFHRGLAMPRHPEDEESSCP